MTPSHNGFGYTQQADSDFMYEIDTTGFNTTLTLEDAEHPGFVNLCIDFSTGEWKYKMYENIAFENKTAPIFSV